MVIIEHLFNFPLFIRISIFENYSKEQVKNNIYCFEFLFFFIQDEQANDNSMKQQTFIKIFSQPNLQNNYILTTDRMTNTITLDFSVNATTSLGEEVFVCGNISELGSWNTGNAFKLHTSKDLYPEWRNRKPLIISPNISLEFKIFIRGAQGNIRWQKIQQNRKFVPIESVLISFSESRHDMTFQSRENTEQEVKFRKNTLDIIRDLSDEVSQSSSGNERQFWNQKNNRERKSMSSSKQFVADSKIIFETWSPNKQKTKHHYINAWAQIVTSTHYIIKKQATNQQQFLQHRQNRTSYNTKNESVIYEQLKVDKKNGKLQLTPVPDDHLKIFHIQEEMQNQHSNNDSWLKNTIRTIKRSEEGFIVVYLLNNNKGVDQDVLNRVEMIVVRNKKTLKESLEKFHMRKNHSVSMLKPNQFLIKKDNHHSVIVLYDPNLPNLNLQFSTNLQYFSSVQKNLLNQKNFHLPENLRLSILMKKDIVRQVHRNRFCLTILCQKIQDINQKIITKLIRVSSCQNVSINIMTADDIQEIYKKLPVSQNDKFLVYNRNGEVFKPGKKHSNIYEEIHISLKKYQEIFTNLKEKAKFWIENRQVQIAQSSCSLQFICENNAIGEVITESLAAQFASCQENRKYPFQIQKYINEDRSKIIVHIRPLLSSTQFYSIIITSINVLPPMNTYFLNFDFTRDKYRFLEKMQRAVGEKKAICEGFIMADQSGLNGLRVSKFQDLLALLLSQAYYSIIDSDLNEVTKSAGKREKDMIKSDLII